MRLSQTIALCLIFSSGCSPLKRAFFNPNTLVPLVGAGVFLAVDDLDEKVSDWATKHYPIYGSSAGASDAGRFFKTILKYETYATSLTVPNEKAKTVGVQLAAWNAVKGATSILKDETNRMRPNGANDLSFPSRCTSFAFSSATISNYNLDYLEFDNLRRGLQFGNLCLASGVGWARIERGAHYPSDVLFGAALGNFLSAFIYDAFLGLPVNEEVRFSVVPFEGGAMAQLSFRF